MFNITISLSSLIGLGVSIFILFLCGIGCIINKIINKK